MDEIGFSVRAAVAGCWSVGGGDGGSVWPITDLLSVSAGVYSPVEEPLVCFVGSSVRGHPPVCVSAYLAVFVSAVKRSHTAVINYRSPPARSHPSLGLLHQAVYSAPGSTIDCAGNCRMCWFENPLSLLSIGAGLKR